jgi:ferredoxin
MADAPSLNYKPSKGFVQIFWWAKAGAREEVNFPYETFLDTKEMETMKMKVEPLKCICCGLCELICGYHWDDALSMTSSSISTYRYGEKNNYFGLMLKTEEDLILGRPEGVDIQKIGGVPGETVSAEEIEKGAAAKPILLRPSCDMCEDFENPLCVEICPTGSLSLE